MKKKKDRFPDAYISEIDKRLAEFDHIHTQSAQQKIEIEKYQHIFKQRDDQISQPEKKKSIWDFEEQEPPLPPNY